MCIRDRCIPAGTVFISYTQGKISYFEVIMVLDQIQNVNDIKNLTEEEIDTLQDEIRTLSLIHILQLYSLSMNWNVCRI